MEREPGISRHKLLYIEWISNKVLLYSTGNAIQYPVINHKGKEYEKEYIHMYWIGQKVHLGFSTTCYGKTQSNQYTSIQPNITES